MGKNDHMGGINAFVMTAQHGSFTAAAERLGLTKSTVGKSVARLEERLGKLVSTFDAAVKFDS
ncbi:LysR family transcriptional regulator [Shewanella bicestrii]|uniref:LysR family transcriptional regulator n=1 Tax=Shewanella bicestrii TaxID=2018305 RepID=UPI00197DD8A9|nr:LysR family transcriptional regulator [Shewanella bicestrii]